MFQTIEDRYEGVAGREAPDLTGVLTTTRLASTVTQDDGLLATAVPVMLAAYGAALGVVALTLAGSGGALFAILISAGYGAVYFGIPLVMARMQLAGAPSRLTVRSHRPLDNIPVLTGLIGRREALLQMVIVPIAVAVAFTGFAIIWVIVKP